MFFLDYTNNGWTADDAAIAFGTSGDQPLAGDWNGDGKDTIGFFRPSTMAWNLDYDNNGVADKTLTYGLSTDLPTTGDWYKT